MKIKANEYVINDAGESLNFRVESDTQTNALIVRGDTGRIGILTDSPSYPMDIIYSGDQGVRVKSSDSHANLLIEGGGTSGGAYARMSSNGLAYWINLQADGSLKFRPAANNNAVVMFQNHDFATYTTGGSLGLFYDASSNYVSVGDNGPLSKFVVVSGHRDNTGNLDSGNMVSIQGGPGNLVQKLNLGVDTTYNTSFIQSVKPGTATTQLNINPQGGPVGINTDGFDNESNMTFQVNDTVLIRGNHSSTDAEIRDWPTASLNIRRTDTHGANGIRMISLGYVDDPLYNTGNAVPNISIWDYGPGAGSATTSTSTTELRIASPGTVGIGAAGSDNQVQITGSGLQLATKTISTLNAGAPEGTIAYVSDDNGNLYFKKGNGAWASFTTEPGTQNNPAVSVDVIKEATGTTTSGYYWIIIAGTPTQVWCDMSDSTPYMLLMRASSGGTAFHYDSAYYTNGTTGLNATGDPLTNIDIKNGTVWNGFTITQMRMTMSTSATAYNTNPLYFSTFNATAQAIFSSGANTWDAQIGYSRAEWLTYAANVLGNPVSNFDSQPNCNTTSINNTGTGPYARVRLGWAGNNEADCATNDSWVGLGGMWNNNQRNGGAQSWSPAVYTPAHIWLWCR